MYSAKRLKRSTTCWLIIAGLLFPAAVLGQVDGISRDIPEPKDRNVIVQLFNWRFNDIREVIPTLRQLGYKYIHVSPPEKSNEQVRQWWGRYQPVDFSKIEGPLGNETEFRDMTDAAAKHEMEIIVDVVLNHTVSLKEAPPGLVEVLGNKVVADKFPQFTPEDFHDRCNAVDDATAERCWLSNDLLDLKTESDHVRQVAKDYLKKLATLGAAGFRFDAAKHIETEFFSNVLSAVPGKYAFGEIIATCANNANRCPKNGFGSHLDVPDMDYYDFPLLATMREAFRSGGDLRILEDPARDSRALPGPKAVTFVRNHDIDRGQANKHGIDSPGGRDTFGVGWDTFGVGWDEKQHRLDRTDVGHRSDVSLAYAYVLGREDGLPYVFVDMKTLPPDEQHNKFNQDDKFDDPIIVAGIRFHNLCLPGTGGVARRPDRWRIWRPDVIAWQRGTDRFVVINKADKSFEISNLHTTLQQGEYKDVRTGWPMYVEPDGVIQSWTIQPRTAVMFVRIPPVRHGRL